MFLDASKTFGMKHLLNKFFNNFNEKEKSSPVTFRISVARLIINDIIYCLSFTFKYRIYVFKCKAYRFYVCVAN